MPPRTAPPPLTTGLVVADVAELDARHPEAVIKVTPAGSVITRDGRPFIFDPAALVARFEADGIDVPVDLDHGTSRRAMWGERADAVGWIKELTARPDGTYARVEWLEAGLAALAGRTHRYISPTFHHTEAGLATWLHSVALVTAPALAMPAVAAADPTTPHLHTHPEPSMLKAIAAALGLAPEADEAACLAAIAKISTGKVDQAIHDAALANLAAASGKVTDLETRLAALAAADRKGKVDALMEEALAAKKIVPAQRAAYEALCATDEGLTQVRALLASTLPGLQPSGLSARVPATTDAADDPAALAAQATEYVKAAAAQGRTISHAEAVIAIKEGRK